jgi:hypothetical protein
MKIKNIEECETLAEEILKNIELSEIPMDNIILKGLRLCRLMGDEQGIDFFSYESSGYPIDKEGYLTNRAWEICKIAGRIYIETNDKKEKQELAYTETIAEMLETINIQTERMKSAKDPQSYGADFTPYMISCAKNVGERNGIVAIIKKYEKRIGIVKGKIYDYTLKIYNQLTYSNTVEDIFTEKRKIVDVKLLNLCPETIRKFSSIFLNMDSNNPEDWANAVHTCRRILKEVADNLYPPKPESIFIGKKEIKLGEEQYVNRLIQYIESKSKSSTYNAVVGSNLSYIGNRIDSVNNAACKGTHDKINLNEAKSYVIYTYLLLGDILNLE